MSFGLDPNPTEDKDLWLLWCWLWISPIISALRAVYKQSSEDWGTVSLCPGTHLIWGRERQGDASEPSLEHPCKALLGGDEPWELHMVTALTRGWRCPAWEQTQISLLRIGVSHAKHPEPDLHSDFNCANHPPHRLSLLLSVKHHQFAHSNTRHIRVSHRTQVSPWALPIPQETERVTLSDSLLPKNPQKHLFCEQLSSN